MSVCVCVCVCVCKSFPTQIAGGHLNFLLNSTLYEILTWSNKIFDLLRESILYSDMAK